MDNLAEAFCLVHFTLLLDDQQPNFHDNLTVLFIRLFVWYNSCTLQINCNLLITIILYFFSVLYSVDGFFKPMHSSSKNSNAPQESVSSLSTIICQQPCSVQYGWCGTFTVEIIFTGGKIRTIWQYSSLISSVSLPCEQSFYYGTTGRSSMIIIIIMAVIIIALKQMMRVLLPFT